MSIATHIKATLELPTMVVHRYLDDLTDEDLFVRPFAGMNHIAWQLGHLIVGENFHINQLQPDSMPTLPNGFSNQHTAEAADNDDRWAFCTKSEYLSLMADQRAGTLAVLEGLTDEELSKPSPKSISYFGSTIGAVFAGEATHWMMHAGQWVVVRRKLGRPPLF